MRIFKTMALFYLAVVGLCVHLALGGIWLFKPSVIWKVEEKSTEWLFKRYPFLAWGDAARMQFTDEQVFEEIPPWEPLPATSSAPAPGSARIGNRVFQSVQDAANALRPGDVLEIGPGVYRTAVTLKISDVSIVGDGHVVFEGAVAQGKANMVIAGNDVRVRNIECRQIQVSDGNGACIRLEGENLTVDHVYYHDSQQGILTGGKPGWVNIRDSRFERLGHNGQSHGIYIGGGELFISDSLFLASKSEGHEIKTRAVETTITRSVIASLNGVDSRLIDAPNGGILVITESILLEGPNTSNSDVVGFALETGVNHHPIDRVVMRDNLILIDRERSSRLLHLADGRVETDVSDNVIISRHSTPFDDLNVIFSSRKSAGLPDYPALLLDRLGASKR
jgi:hypothetical protein